MLSAECQMATLVAPDTLLDKAREGVPLIGAVKVPAQDRLSREASMTIALYAAAAVIMAVGSLYFAWRNRDFRKFLAGASSYHRVFCSISISPMFRCLCWGPVLSKHLRLAVADPSSISSSSCFVSILASSGSQRLKTNIPVHHRLCGAVRRPLSCQKQTSRRDLS